MTTLTPTNNWLTERLCQQNNDHKAGERARIIAEHRMAPHPCVYCNRTFSSPKEADLCAMRHT